MSEFTKEEYQAKVEAVFNRFPSVQKVDFGKAYKPGLEGMERFAACLGNPQDSFRAIHVAGTNGKGSVANMLASALQAVGLRVGLYTSPHILDFRERMRVDGGMVPESYVFDFLTANDSLMDELGLSFFELTTGMAFKWFADSGVDVAVVETGLGGRLDSTNILTPDLAIVTNIALDHCALLGDSLEAIAAEKAGIFKKGTPALVGEVLPRTRPIFEAKSEGFCPLSFATDSEPSLWERKDEILAAMDLRGDYQRKNLRTVLAAIDILKGVDEYAGLAHSAKVVDAIERTAGRMHFPARWEKLSDEPLVIADMGHNPAALRGNFAQLERMRDEEGRSLVIVFAIMADKDLGGILPLMPADADYVLTAPRTSRALPARELHSRFLAHRAAGGEDPSKDRSAETERGVSGAASCLDPSRVHCAQTVEEALSLADRLSEARKSLVYIGGSAYLVSEVEQLLEERLSKM